MKKVNYLKKVWVIFPFFVGCILFHSCSSPNYKQTTVCLSEACSVEQQTEAYEIIIKRISSIGAVKEKSALINGHFDITYYLEEDTTMSILPLISHKGEVYISPISDSRNVEQAQKLYLNPSTVKKGTMEKETPQYLPQGHFILPLTIELKEEYHETFARMTAENIDKPLYLVVDGKIIASPTVSAVIKDGKVSISEGIMYTKDDEPSEWYKLKALIASGALPCEAKIIGSTDTEKNIERTTVLSGNFVDKDPTREELEGDTIVKNFIVKAEFQSKTYDIPFQLKWTTASTYNDITCVAFYQLDRLGGSSKIEIKAEIKELEYTRIASIFATVKFTKSERFFDKPYNFTVNFTADGIDSTENIYKIDN